jgi:hypothetical protein
MGMVKIVKQDDFDEKKKRHDEAMETNKDYRRDTESLSFSVGKRMELVIEVTDEFFSQNIINLLRGNLEGFELLGFKVQELIIYPESREKIKIKEKLQRMIYDLDNEPN